MIMTNENFRKSVHRVVRGIPPGETMTYKEVARQAGRPNAYRAVGNILHQNHDPAIPCHRVIRSDGGIGGYNKGETKKRALLAREARARFSAV